ncbi:MAG TPA: MerR family transcriptional regulator [Microvirga sp.]|jgi:DNA-binding transcriptional MerR regulator|nr:MerR family transcriptional regulator [Microvirga sp.]
MLIKEFCEATGLPRDTVRFYVKQGLLTPEVGSRRSNRYQVFSAEEVERAKLIKVAQRLGFTLKEIARLAEAYENQSLTRERKADVLRSQLATLGEQAKLLDSMRAFLTAKLAWLEGGEVGPPPKIDSVTRPKVSEASLPKSASSARSRREGVPLQKRAAARRS